MKDHPIKLSRVMAICLIVAVVTAGIVRATSPTQPFTINRGVYPGATSFTIWEEDGNYFAKNSYGVLAYSGNNASAVFNNAISDVNSNGGGVVQVSAGTYYFTKPVNLKSYVHLKGEHYSNTILTVADGTSDDWGVHHVVVQLNETSINVEISNFQIDNNEGGIAYALGTLEVRDPNSNFKLHDCYFPDDEDTSTGGAISLGYGNGAKIYNNYMGNMRLGIYIFNSTNCLIFNNHLESATDEGFYIGEYDSHITIQNNVIKNVNLEGIDIKSNSQYINVFDNQFSNCTNGIFDDGTHNTFVGNSLNNCTNGIYLSPSAHSGAVATGNHITNCATTGIGFADGSSASITGNSVYDCTTAIRVYKGDNVTISGNIVYNNYDGILLWNATWCVVNNNIVINAEYHGIGEYTSASDYNCIVGNTVRECLYGIRVLGANSECHSCFNLTSWIT